MDISNAIVAVTSVSFGSMNYEAIVAYSGVAALVLSIYQQFKIQALAAKNDAAKLIAAALVVADKVLADAKVTATALEKKE
jgi:hypothetical protein